MTKDQLNLIVDILTELAPPVGAECGADMHPDCKWECKHFHECTRAYRIAQKVMDLKAMVRDSNNETKEW